MLENKVIMLVGASGGIGSAVAKKADEYGATTILIARNHDPLKTLALNLKHAKIMTADATNLEQMQNCAKKIYEEYGRIDVLIHAVGDIVLRPIHSLSEKQFRDSLEKNLITAFFSMKAAVKYMMKKKKGAIVGISSVAAKKGMRNHAAISASKSGLEGLIRSSAVTYANKGIRFNAVALGLIDTPLAQRNNLTTSEKAIEISNKLHPLGRFGTTEDVVDQILFLASDKSSWMTGAIIPIDGGLSVA
jgi:NAD(P)-dependent dehydrogenase (short-subunit alcohol dehydrogenase family)